MHITACSCKIDMLSGRTESPSEVTRACGHTHRRLLGGHICGQVKLATGALLAQVDHALKLVVCTEAPAALVGVVECWSLHGTVLYFDEQANHGIKNWHHDGARLQGNMWPAHIWGPCTCKPSWSGYEMIGAQPKCSVQAGIHSCLAHHAQLGCHRKGDNDHYIG